MSDTKEILDRLAANRERHFISTVPSTRDMTFFGGTTTSHEIMTITHDGRMLPGKGLSEDEATQRLAQMLVEKFEYLWKEKYGK